MGCWGGEFLLDDNMIKQTKTPSLNHPFVAFFAYTLETLPTQKVTVEILQKMCWSKYARLQKSTKLIKFSVWLRWYAFTTSYHNSSWDLSGFAAGQVWNWHKYWTPLNSSNYSRPQIVFSWQFQNCSTADPFKSYQIYLWPLNIHWGCFYKSNQESWKFESIKI